MEAMWAVGPELISSPWWGPISVVVTLVLWLAPPRRSMIWERASSNHRDDRAALKAVLGKAPAIRRYKLAVGEFNSFLDDWFGPSVGSKAMGRCFQIALLYPLTLFVFVWLVSGRTPVSSLYGVETSAAFVDRFWRICVLIMCTCVLVWPLVNLYSLEDFASRADHRSFKSLKANAFVKKLISVSVYINVLVNGFYYFLTMILLSILFAGVCLAGHYVASMFGVMFILIFGSAASVSFADRGVISRTHILFLLFLITLSIFLALISQGSGGVSLRNLYFVLVMYLIVPLLNAGMDWASWGITRFFLNRVARAENSILGAFAIIIDVFSDFMFGFILLFLLSISLPFGIEIMNLLISSYGGEPVDWVTSLKIAVRDPWGEGLFVTGMLVTTLVPTFLHLVAGLAGVFFAWTPDAQALADRIPYDPNRTTQDELSVDLRNEIVVMVRRVRYWYIPAGLVVLTGMYYLIYLFSATITPFGEFLAASAYCGTAWVGHSECGLWLKLLGGLSNP